MRINTRKTVRAYYTEEVLQKKIPPFPLEMDTVSEQKKGQSSRRDAVFLAAVLFSSLIIITVPRIYESPLRHSYIPLRTIEVFKEEFPRVLFEASVKYKESKGV